MSAIRFDAVTLRYPGWFTKRREALSGVCFEILRGESFGFVGENGAGKSSAIKLMLGFLGATGGEVRLNGRDPRDPAARVGVGYVPEVPSLPQNLTPREALRLGAALRSGTRAIGEAEIDRLMDRLDVRNVADKPIGKFSKGMSQRVAIALALVGDPSLLILDEPLSGLDPKGRADVVNILSEYQRGGGTVFFSSHVLHDVERLAHRVALIHDGRLRAIHDVAELLQDTRQGYVIRHIPKGGGVRHEHASTTCGHGELGETIARLEQSGAIVLEVTPRQSLESRFLEMVG